MQFTVVGPVDRRDARGLTELARMADDFGLHSIGTPDTGFRLGEAATRTTLLALGVTRTYVGMRPTNPWTRDPQIAAAFAASIDAMTGGRAFLEFATGDTAVTSVGRRPAARARLEEYVRCVRDLWTHGTGHHDGREIRVYGGSRPAPRVSIGAEGPRMLHLAGRIGDAVSIGTGLTPEVVRDSLERVRQGSLAEGRQPDVVEPWFTVRSILAEDGEGATARAALLPSLASVLYHSMRAGVWDRMVDERHHGPVEEFVARYETGAHQRGGGANERLLTELGLSGFAHRRWGMAGDPADWIERIEELRGAGVRRMWLSSLGGVGQLTVCLRTFGERVLPRVT
jgi:5,10-methylenetetrahydromethanopterin reductase